MKCVLESIQKQLGILLHQMNCGGGMQQVGVSAYEPGRGFDYDPWCVPLKCTLFAGPGGRPLLHMWIDIFKVAQHVW